MTVCRLILLALLLSGCSLLPERVEYVEPDCTVPPMPAPPEISAEELDPLPDDVFWRLRERDDALVSAIVERQRMLEALCEDGG